MKFKISKCGNNSEPNEKVNCIAWSSAEEIYSYGENHALKKWCLKSGSVQSTTTIQFSNEFYPTHIQWHPLSPSALSPNIKSQSLDVLLITSADGKFYFVNRNGRIEKVVDAHKGAILVGQWVFDGSALLTAGEDGTIKIWSRSGILRSTVVRGTQPILAASWSLDCTSVLYSQGTQLILQSINTTTKPIKWYAHDGLVLTLSWNKNNGLIVSGGEDCRYKLWDSNGNQLFSSGVVEYPITAVSWCPNGMSFVVGFYDTIKLCDKAGWVHSMQKIDGGTINSIAWSNDGTQLAMTCGNSYIITAHLIDRSLEWNNHIATLVSRKVIEITEVKSEHTESFEISDKVLHFEFAYDHLVVVTPSQCHIYSSTNWNTPVIFSLKNIEITAIILADKHFLLIEWNNLTLYNYQGRRVTVPKWKGMLQDSLNISCIALCSSALFVQDQTDKKILHILELSSNKPVLRSQQYVHSKNILEITVSTITDQNLHQVAMIDTNSDLYLLTTGFNGFERVRKIASMAQSIAWATDAHVLVAIQDATLSIWLWPSCIRFNNKKTIQSTRVDKEINEFGKQPSIVRVHNGIVTVRRSDGALVSTACYTFFMSFHQYVTSGKWQKALSLCRIVQNELLWTCLAIGASEKNEISAAEEAYSAIERYEEVEYIQRLQNQVVGKTKKLIN